MTDSYATPIRPSQVEKFTRCPTLWLREDIQGWRRPASPFNVNILMGTAFHAGMATYWRGSDVSILSADALDVEQAVILADALDVDRAVEAASVTLARGWAGTEHSLEGMTLLLGRMIQATIAWCQKEIPDATPLLVEHQLGPDGATPDLVIRNRGQLEIIDWKSHLEVKPERIPYRLQDPDHSHQFQDYIWRVSEYLSEPVRLFRAVHIIGLPKLIVRETTFVPSEAQLAEWLRQARRKWHMMAMIKTDPGLVYRNETGCAPYGSAYPCPMWAFCWDCHGNPEVAEQFYTREEK